MRLIVAAAIALAGCGQKAKAPDPPPDWRRYTVDGMAPMMTPDQIERALAVNGYRPRGCGGEPIVPDALRRSNDLICYEAPAKRLNATLFFRQQPEGRRLSSLRLYETGVDRRGGTPASYAPFLRSLVARWGPPDRTQGQADKIRLWIVPGASPTLPDNVTTGESDVEGRNIAMTSFWALQREVKVMPATNR